MSVEFLNLLKYEAKIETDSKSAGGHWLRRKEALRAKRGRHDPHKVRARRQIDTITSITEEPDLVDKPSTRRTQSHSSRISAGESVLVPLTAAAQHQPYYNNNKDHCDFNRQTEDTEWSGATGGPPAEVVLRLHPPSSTSRVNASLADIDGSGVVVRAEEALIVAFVLLLWVAAIALFFNRWGKIRCVYKLMLEPYQPKFQQQHRQSCALAENSVSVPPHHRASLSRGCVSYDCGASFPAYQPCGYLSHRPRQNSVFVSSMGMGGMALIPESPPRRSRSAADIPALITPSEMSHHTPRSSRAASLHSAVDIRVAPSPRTSRAASLHSAVDMPPGSVQVHVRGSGSNLNRPRSPRRLTITNV